MSKINIVRSIKSKNIKDEINHNREIGWNNRFHLAKLQPYDPNQDAYFVNMKLLREQFKLLEQSYKNTKPTFYLNDKRYKPNIINNKNSEIGNSILNNTNLHGSYNNININNEKEHKNFFIEENLINDPIIKDLNKIINLWDDLGVTDNYRVIFENLSRDIDPLMRKDLFENEISALRKFSELLYNISKEIEQREILISQIHQIDDAFLGIDSKEEILSDLVSNLKNVRITSINIITYLQKIREQCSYNVLGGKFNLDKINKSYKFDKNYLIKMKFDMDFLRNSKLATYFEFEPCESDPFLLYFYFKNNKLEKKFGMRISDDMLSAVKQGQYLILQDLIFFNINSIYMKNMQKENKNLNKIKGIYGRDFSQPKSNNNNINSKIFGVTSTRLYSPPKKNVLNDIRPSTTATGFNNLIKNTNSNNLMNQNNKNNIENQFEATSTNFFKINNISNNIKVPKIHIKEDSKKSTPIQNIHNNKIDKNNIVNINENLNYNIIQNEFLNPIQTQNARGLSVNNKDITNDINNFSNQMNQNYMNNGFQMNMYQNQQMNQTPYHNINNNNFGNFNNMYNPFMTNLPINYHMINSQNFNYNNPFANNQIQHINNNTSAGFNNFNNSTANNNLIISSMNKIEIIPGNIKRQNTDKSNFDNSKIIKVKSEDIIAIDKKDKNNFNKKVEDSSLSIKTEGDNIKTNNKKENVNEMNNKNNMDLSASHHSRFTKKLEEDLSIQDEIEYQKQEKKITEKSLKNNNFEITKQFKNKSESDILEENDNMDINHPKLETKKSLKPIKNQDSINEDIHSEKNFNKEETKNNNYKNPKEYQGFEDSFKKSLKNNSNISENLTYKSEKKIKKEIKTSFNEDMNNKENSIDDIIDSKSLKDIENEIHSDFKNDQPVIEESKKSIELRDHSSPKNYVSQSRLVTENKFDKLEIINEESMDKSKSNLREINHKNNFYDKKDNFENDNMEMEIYEDEKYGNNNNNFENSAISKGSKNLGRNKNREKPQANIHETFDSLKSNTIKSQKDLNEDLKMKNLSNKKLPEIIKTEENYDFEKNEEKEKSKISEEAQEEIEDESKEIEEKSILDNEASRLSKYSTVSKKNKAAGKISKQIFEELKQKALVVCVDPDAEYKKENNTEKDLNKTEEVVEENFNENNISQNKSLINRNMEKIDELNQEDPKQLIKKDDNEILEEENLENNHINKSINQKDIIDNEKNQNILNEEETDFINNEKNKEDPDAIEEENHLANEENINKSFKTKKSVASNKKEITENDKNENIEINKDNNEIPYEENIIDEELKGKDNIDNKISENDLEQDDKICEIPKIDNKETKQKENFNDLKNQININFIAGENIKEWFDQYKSYIGKLNSEQKITFKPKESIIDYLNFFNSKIIKITKIEENELIGLCCLSFDNSWEDSIKLNINHISFLNYEYFEELVDLTFNFIKEKFNVIDEIIIELNYENKDSNFEINKELRDLFKNKFNFKWNKLENKNGERIQKMSLNINNQPNETKTEVRNFMHNTLEINYFTILNLSDKEKNNIDYTDPSNSNNNDNCMNNINYFSLISSLCQIKNSQNKINSEMLEKYDIQKIKRHCRNFITLVNQEDEQDKDNYEKLKNIIPEQFLNQISVESSFKNVISLMKLNLKFNNFSTHIHKNYIYNRINGSISTLINEELNHKFYVILTADGNYTILITEMTNGFKDFLDKNKNENIYKLFDGLYNNLKNTSADESAAHIENKNIWIPSFANKKDYLLNLNNISDFGENDSSSLINDLKNTKIENLENGEHKTIRKISESYNSIFRFDKDYKRNPILNPLEDDIIINDAFFISVINLDVLADSHISTVFISIIDKELWIEN